MATALADIARAARSSAEPSASQARDRKFIEQLTQYCLDRIDALYHSSNNLEDYARQKRYSVPVEGIYLPRSGEPLSYFAGYENGYLLDATKNGVPAIALFQGYKPRDSRTPDPTTLPAGKTVIDYLNDALLERAGGNIDDALKVRTRFNSKERCLVIHLVWDIAEWDRQEAVYQKKRAERQHDGNGRSLEEYRQEQEQKRLHRQQRAA